MSTFRPCPLIGNREIAKHEGAPCEDPACPFRQPVIQRPSSQYRQPTKTQREHAKAALEALREAFDRKPDR